MDFSSGAVGQTTREFFPQISLSDPVFSSVEFSPVSYQQHPKRELARAVRAAPSRDFVIISNYSGSLRPRSELASGRRSLDARPPAAVRRPATSLERFPPVAVVDRRGQRSGGGEL